MSDKLTDLGITDEAIEAAELAMQFDAARGATYWELAHVALAAAVPLLRKAWEQELRQQIAAEIEAAGERDRHEREAEADAAFACDQPDWECHASGAAVGFFVAANIARGTSEAS